MSGLDNKWMNPYLKQVHRAMKREYFKNRKSNKFLKLKTKLKKLKKESLRKFYSDFVTNLKSTDPGKWYMMAKKIGAVDNLAGGNIQVESLSTDKECAQQIAEHFAKISNEYLPINPEQLPAYLPAQPPPQVEEIDVYQRIKRIRKSKSTLPIDIPDTLRKECSPFLAHPLEIIINDCISKSKYPEMWKL